jgi:tetratricopeptide (TPR) repeat protein
MTRRWAIFALCWLIAAGCAAIPTIKPTGLPPAEGAFSRGDELYQIPRSAERVRQAALNYEAAAGIAKQAGEALWRAARAYGWLAQYGPLDKEQRERDAARGIQLARRAIKAAPQEAESHYYLAVNLGLFSDLRAVMNHLAEMAKEAQRAAEIDPLIDDAGPYRLLGSLYGLAPGPPFSLGDEERGLDYLRKAVKLAPDNPENHVRLAELLVAEGEKAEAKRHLERALFLDDDEADPTETLAWQTQAKKLWEQVK